MITLERPAYYDSKRYNEYCGLSTDDKATISAYNGDEFYEINTGKYYKYNQVSNEWVEQPTSGGGAGGSGVQSDWNQNDDTQPDYVKNRPFYTGDPVETVLLEETTAEFTEQGGLYLYELRYPLLLEVGQTYQVSWDGTVYECVGTGSDGDTILGNLSIIDAGEDTGEPFLCGFGQFITKDTSASHTISISTNVVPVKRIDKKYIPEGSPYYLSKENPNGTGSFSLNRFGTIGDFSFAEGYKATASGARSHAECYSTTASGDNSHAEGAFTTASGNSSHAEGNNTTASGENSHAEGADTKASSNNQHVQGKYNIEDPSGTYAHIVGNGKYSPDGSKRSNAHTLDWSGNAWYAGTVEGKALILPSSTEGSTKKFRITVDDSGTLKATEVT